MPRRFWKFLGKYRQNRPVAVVGRDEARAEPYPYVWIDAGGSARELHADQRRYLETPFVFPDGARPYVKTSHSQKNGWGELSGFLDRSKLPPDMQIQPAPTEAPGYPATPEQHIAFLRSKGLQIVENSDGTVTITKPGRRSDLPKP